MSVAEHAKLLVLVNLTHDELEVLFLDTSPLKRSLCYGCNVRSEKQKTVELEKMENIL